MCVLTPLLQLRSVSFRMLCVVCHVQQLCTAWTHASSHVPLGAHPRKGFGRGFAQRLSICNIVGQSMQSVHADMVWVVICSVQPYFATGLPQPTASPRHEGAGRTLTATTDLPIQEPALPLLTHRARLKDAI